MKKLSYFLLVALVLTGCARGFYAPSNVNQYGVQTQVVLDKANFRIVRHLEVVIDVNNSNLKRVDVEKSAYAELLRRANLTGSQALVNVVVEEVKRESSNIFRVLFAGGLPKVEQHVAARATVIEFLDDKGNPIPSVSYTGSAPVEQNNYAAPTQSYAQTAAPGAQPQSTATQEVKANPKEELWVDLGLPSGTLWKKSNEKGLYTYDAAMEQFADALPTQEQFQELKDNCTWKNQGRGYKVIGKNGNFIILPAEGMRNCKNNLMASDYGTYWSSTIKEGEYASILNFNSDAINISVNKVCNQQSVRLVQKK